MTSLITRPLVNTAAKSIPSTVLHQTANPPFPVLLSDQVTVPAGGEQAFRSELFTNNTGRPIELHSLRVTSSLAPAIGSIVPAPGVRSAGLVALSIVVDGVKMTRGDVPVWGMCRSDNRLNETQVNVRWMVNGLCWYFSHPVPLRPGRGIRVTAKHLGGIPANVTVGVSFAGRVSPAPIPNRVPFVAAWTSRSFGYAEVGTDSTPPDALANDTGRDLTIDRIVGRSIAFDDGAIGGELADYDDVSTQGISSFLVRMGLSQSRPILKTYTPWRTVFGQNAAVEGKTILRPGDYLTADIAHIAGPTLPTPFTYSQNRGLLSIVGWREV